MRSNKDIYDMANCKYCNSTGILISGRECGECSEHEMHEAKRLVDELEAPLENK